MDWPHIRDHYIRLFKIADRTQDEVAKAAKLSGQNAISRLLANEKLGPSVETFIKAILGLGITPSQFFAALEQADPASSSTSETRTGGVHATSSAPLPPVPG
jgi:transcriptional regulator with XRE-family HTH domain